jgi:phosphoribosylaminoimidazolecarboxamide formyltransferase/IMP cyclohydrolase
MTHTYRNYENTGRAIARVSSSLRSASFWHTAGYDQAIATYLGSQEPQVTSHSLPQRFALSGQQLQSLRYGENPHQPAAWYQTGTTSSGWAAAKKLQGKELSYNNLVDLEAARRLIAEFTESMLWQFSSTPIPVALHWEPVQEAYEKAFNADPISAFGGIVALNCPIDAPTATALTQTF